MVLSETRALCYRLVRSLDCLPAVWQSVVHTSQQEADAHVPRVPTAFGCRSQRSRTSLLLIGGRRDELCSQLRTGLISAVC